MEIMKLKRVMYELFKIKTITKIMMINKNIQFNYRMKSKISI